MMPTNPRAITLRHMLNQDALATFRTVYPSLSKADQLALVKGWQNAVAAELRKVEKRPEPGMCTPRRRSHA